jgi:pilus assembly protein Flp/PilA
MRPELSKFIFGLRRLLTLDDGQDMIEYALVVALIAFGATATMHSLADGISTAYTNLSTHLASDVT